MKRCKICGIEKPGKRKVCLDCKEREPYVASEKGSKPFMRKRLLYG